MRFPFVLLLLLLLPGVAQAQDWLQWRGPTGDQHAASGATAPDSWTETENIAWRVAVPGRGHSSPTLVGPRIYLTTGDNATKTQSLLIFDRASGSLLKQTPVHQGVSLPRMHPSNSHASPTVASDGQRVFTLFHNNDALWASAFDLDGNQLWQKRVAEFTPQRFQFGYGASPIIAGDRMIVVCEYDGPEAGIYALDLVSGETDWKADRPNSITFSSAITANLGGKTQLLISGNSQVASFDPTSGEQNWSTPGGTLVTCGTVVWDAALGLIYAGGGVPQPFVLAVKADGSSEEPVWRHTPKVYEQSMLALDGYLYAVSDNSIAYCWRGEDGEEMWSHRLGGKWSSSPVLIDGKIYVSNESGTSWVYKATPDGYEEVSENQLGTDIFATPTPADGRLYLRYGDATSGERQEYLVAIGE